MNTRSYTFVLARKSLLDARWYPWRSQRTKILFSDAFTNRNPFASLSQEYHGKGNIKNIHSYIMPKTLTISKVAKISKPGGTQYLMRKHITASEILRMQMLRAGLEIL